MDTRARAMQQIVAMHDTILQAQLAKNPPTTPEDWAEYKLSYVKEFGVNEAGDLTVPNGTGGVDRVIVLPNRNPATREEIKTYYNTRAEQLKEPEEEFAKAKRTLHDVMAGYHAGTHTKRDVIDANHAVHKADCILNTIAKGNRIVNTEYDEQQNLLNFDWYNRKKFAGPISIAEYSIFPWSIFWKDGPERTPEQLQTQPVPTQADLNRQEGGKLSTHAPQKSPSDAARIGAIIHARKERANFQT